MNLQSSHTQNRRILMFKVIVRVQVDKNQDRKNVVDDTKNSDMQTQCKITNEPL